MKEEGECFEEQILMQQFQMMQQNGDLFGGGLIFNPEVSPLMFPGHQVHAFNPFSNPTILDHHDSFILPPPPPTSYGSFFNRRNASSLHFPHYDNVGCAPFELSKMTAQEIMDAKALAASKSHSEAERRRRERINNHLAKLRSLLPNTTKTDKASLLAEVIQHVKELKRQTTLIADVSLLPTELDELSVDVDASDEDGKFVIKASFCCEDRSDLLPQIIKTLKSLHLRTLKAEITTLGGRVRNVLFITGDDDSSNDEQDQPQQQHQYSISSIQEALKSVMEKVCSEDHTSSGSIKRQRTNNHNNINIIQHRSF
ncbi:transcription factor bHLH30-like [Benincasa hispida]|uniref:transcription factor bHLH30-like n=1 Tax=Benincasa hispida TaxID=102211 RepID=UPI0018FF90C5|nr:transcription factor bHLH30-like [Benincasa hispida]